MMRLEMFDHLPPATPFTRIVAIVFALLFLITGVREIIAPTGMDVGFGMPLASDDGLAYLSVVGARNIALSLLGLFAALTGMRAAMAAVFAAIALMAALDCYVVITHAGLMSAVIKHASFAVIFAGVSVWVAYARGRRALDTGPISSA